MPERQSQLWMRLHRVDTVAAPQLPQGYALRTLQPGDETAWIALLNSVDFDPWDEQRLERMLTRTSPRLQPDGVFFITHGATLAASACMFLQKEPVGAVGELGWVVVHPAHRGKGLGMQACLAALRYARQRDVTSVFLRTEEARPAAIRIYLRLGFEPEMRDETHPGRWAALLPTLQQ